MDVIDTVITDECVGEYISLKDRVGLRQEIYDSIKGMDILDSILQDENSGITDANSQIKIPLYPRERLKMGLS